MKKYICLLLALLAVPIFVNASGNSDDDTLGVSHLNINCVYEQQSVKPGTHGELIGNGTYINLEFVGISDSSGSGTSFTYNFGNLDNNGKFEKRYKYFFSERWLNYHKGFGDHEFWIQGWWSKQMREANSLDLLPASEIQKKADNGGLCIPQVIIVQSKKDDAYYFLAARDNADRITLSNELYYSGDYKNQKNYYFTGTTIAISNINQESLEDTNAEEKMEEVKQQVEDNCDPNSPNYNEEKCTETKIVAGATEETVSNIASYDNNSSPKSDTSLKYGKVTCETLFMKVDVNGVKHYNDTHKLLSTVLKFMQYLAVVLALVLSTVDFIKVVPTNDKDALKKSTSKAVTRLIIAIIIFFVPVLLNFILSLVGFNSPTCGLL